MECRVKMYIPVLFLKSEQEFEIHYLISEEYEKGKKSIDRDRISFDAWGDRPCLSRRRPNHTHA